MFFPLLSCGIDPAADRQAYQKGHCEQIRDRMLGDECRLFAVRQNPALADIECSRIQQDFLRDECWFIVVDAEKLRGEAARQGCTRAGRYAGACISNAISRESTWIKENYPQTEWQERLVLMLVEYHRPNPVVLAEKLADPPPAPP